MFISETVNAVEVDIVEAGGAMSSLISAVTLEGCGKTRERFSVDQLAAGTFAYPAEAIV